jgi:heme-degrading monooxygenase HmoA
VWLASTTAAQAAPGNWRLHMLARIWRGETPAEKGEAYLAFLEQSGLKDYRAVPGNRGVWVLRRERDGRAEFTLISLWESLEAMQGFAGDDYMKAVYYPEDKDFLLGFAPEVEVYDVARVI